MLAAVAASSSTSVKTLFHISLHGSSEICVTLVRGHHLLVPAWFKCPNGEFTRGLRLMGSLTVECHDVRQTPLWCDSDVT
jgi:hypothetical protein